MTERITGPDCRVTIERPDGSGTTWIARNVFVEREVEPVPDPAVERYRFTGGIAIRFRTTVDGVELGPEGWLGRGSVLGWLARVERETIKRAPALVKGDPDDAPCVVKVGDLRRLLALCRALYEEHDAAGDSTLSDTPDDDAPVGPWDRAWDRAADVIETIESETVGAGDADV